MKYVSVVIVCVCVCVCCPVGGMKKTNVMNTKLISWFMRRSTQISCTPPWWKKRR